MKRIKQIIDALKVLSRTPSKTIREAADEVLRIAGGNGRGEETASDNNFNLISNLLDAVVAFAEDEERKVAKPDGEAKA